MESHELLNKLISESPTLTQNKLGAAMGFIPQTMSKRMNAKRLGIDFVARALGLLGYDLVAVPKQTRLPKGSIVVTAGDE